jgi:DNA-binding response OmpR family regulator
MNQPRIGIVDDEAHMRDALVALLSKNQFDPVPMAGSAEFTRVQEKFRLDLVLIDLQLRGESGLELAVDIRRKYDLPIVMLTGRGDETDKIVGLEIGADDYLLKPFNPRELVARIRAVLRRCGKASSAIIPAASKEKASFAQFTLDRTGRTFLDGRGCEVALTNAEYRLLDYFLGRPDQIIGRAELLEELGNDVSRFMDRTIDVLILRLRRKIEANPSKPEYLQTRRGEGYIFVTRPAGKH